MPIVSSVEPSAGTWRYGLFDCLAAPGGFMNLVYSSSCASLPTSHTSALWPLSPSHLLCPHNTYLHNARHLGIPCALGDVAEHVESGSWCLGCCCFPITGPLVRERLAVRRGHTVYEPLCSALSVWVCLPLVVAQMRNEVAADGGLSGASK